MKSFEKRLAALEKRQAMFELSTSMMFMVFATEIGEDGLLDAIKGANEAISDPKLRHHMREFLAFLERGKAAK